MGQILSSGTTRFATALDLHPYERMRQQLAKQPVPVLQHHKSSHEYLFIALFDGTGQDVNDPRQLPTNIGVLAKRAFQLRQEPQHRIGSHYVQGIGTQGNPVARVTDGALAYSWDDRIKEMYRALANRAWLWQQEDPQAQVRLIEVGYSRGAVLVPGLARLVDQYGIAHPQGLAFDHDVHGNLTVQSSRTLVSPGQVAQAVGLFDPVGTNMPRNYDARLPKSVLSGFSQIARDEQRELFPHQTILDPDWSDDGRFLSATMPGGHSNVGGGNPEDGLEALAFNGMADYLNSLTDRPLFEHRPVPADPSQYTIFQAQGATAAFGLRMDDDGQRNLRDELANCKIVDVCHDAEPVDMALARQFQWREVQTLAEPMPTLTEPLEQSSSLRKAEGVSLPPPTLMPFGGEERTPDAVVERASPPKSPSDLILEDYLAAMRAGDEKGMSAAAIAMAHSDYGQQRMAEAKQREIEKRQAIPGRDHPLFGQALQHLERLGPDQAGYWNRTEMEQMAGSIAYEAQRNHMPAIDDLHAVRDGDNLVATWKHPTVGALNSYAVVDKMQAMSQPLEQSLQDLSQETQRQEQEQMTHDQAQERAQKRHVGMSR